MFAILTLVFGLTPSPVFAHDCDGLLGAPSFQSLIRQTRELNPQLLHDDEMPPELYLLLKREEHLYTGRNISAELATHLRAARSKYYRLDEMDMPTLTRFYLNALHALDMRAANEWRNREIIRLVGVDPGLEAMGHLLDILISPRDLNDPNITAEQAEALFRAQPWLSFPWKIAAQALAAFGQKPFHQFVEWAQQNSKLSWNEATRIAVALSRSGRLGDCCYSDSACVTCPHNRKWLN